MWLTPGLRKSELKIVESLHYRCVRLVVKDYRQRTSREIIDFATKRLPPLLWMEYSACNLFINSKMVNQPTKLLQELSTNLYTKRRSDGVLFGFDSSKARVARQRTSNWLGSAICKITTPWTNHILSKDQIRLLLKKHIYPQGLLCEPSTT